MTPPNRSSSWRPAPATPSSAAQVDSTRLRLTFLTLLVVSLFVLLFARLWFVQVMAGERYVNLAEGNAVKELPVAAPRGEILDRDGTEIVTNRFAMVVSVLPSEMGDRETEVLTDLADLLGLTLADVQERIATSQAGPFRPKPIAVDVPDDIIFYIHENGSTRYPGVYAESLPVRMYPEGRTAAHVVGYLGEISPEELDTEEYADYLPGDLIGWSGLERTYEDVLRGTDGYRRVEVNAKGDRVRELPDSVPVPGADLRTTLDLDAQKAVEDALRAGILNARTVVDREGRNDGYFAAPAGAAVVLDPRDGAVIALASYPTYDPAEFVGGVSQDYWDKLQKPKNDYPLINRVTSSSYPPGSVFKIVSASAALEEGYVDTDDELPCPPAWMFGPQTFRNWASYDMGPMDVARSLENSCDTFYYELARRMWTDEINEGPGAREQLSEHAALWGFDEPTGIDLPGERGGVIPGRTWKRQFWEDNRDNYCSQAEQFEEGTYAQELYADLCANGHSWRGGDAVNMSIGQGDVQTTPLQVANAFAAVANGGTLYKPRLAKEILHADGRVETVQPQVLRELGVSPRHLAEIAEGLERVASQGTAVGTFGDFPIPVAGKTGTAEFKPKQPMAWFASYAPANNPRYVVVTFVEEGGGGSLNAAPIARRIYEHLFDLGPSEIHAGLDAD